MTVVYDFSDRLFGSKIRIAENDSWNRNVGHLMKSQRATSSHNVTLYSEIEISIENMEHSWIDWHAW